MVVEERDEPWPRAASLSAGVTASAVQDARSRLMQATFVKTPYLVRGKSTDAAGNQEEVARYYNGLFYTKEWMQAHDDAIHYSLLDGTSYIYIPWVKRVVYRPIIEAVPVLDDKGEPVLDRKGKPKRTVKNTVKRVVEKNGVEPRAVALQDLLLHPASSISVEAANAVSMRVWLMESDLWEMVESGDLWEDAVQDILDSYGQPGQDEHTQLSRKSTYERQGMINVGDAGVSNPTDAQGDGMRQRGPFMFWMHFTREFDLDGDGKYEENVGWIHEQSKILAGIGPYQYWHGRRPFAEFFCGIRDPGRAYGRGIPELTRSFDEEANAIENQRLDLIDLLLSAPRYHKRNVKYETQEQQWGPNADYEVDAPDDIGLLLQNYNVPIISVQEQQMIEARAKALVGVATPGQASMSNGTGAKVSAKQAQAWTASQNVIIDLMAMNTRWGMKEVLEQAHFLTLQYGYIDDEDDDGTIYVDDQNMLPSFDIMGVNGGRGYELDVTGLTGGLDQESQYQKVMTAYSLLRQDPLVAGDLGKWWYVVKMALEQLGRPDIPQIIGSQNDAKEKQQQMEQAQQQKEDREYQLQLASHAKNPPPGQHQNGQKPQQPQQPQQPQPQMSSLGGAN